MTIASFKRFSVLCMAVVATTVLSVVFAPLASATVSAAPASWTPQVTSTDATVRQLVQCGSTMYAVGSFTTVKQGGVTYTRNNAFSFSATTGALTSWNPNVTGDTVESIALSSDCATAYLGGSFTEIGATAVKDIAAVHTSDGTVVSTFKHNASGIVHTIALVDSGTQLLVGGAFSSIAGTATPDYVSIDPTSGLVTSYLQAPVSGGYMVYNQSVSSSGDRVLFEGNFTSVSGQARQQVAELDLSSTSATLDAFSNSALTTTSCPISFYVRDATFSPDESTVYLAATGGIGGSSPYCDGLTALTNTANSSVKWNNKTGGDSLYSVAAGSSDVYIGGHERWANNPYGSDSCGFGCVARQGIGDISASSGQATSWNPSRARGKGAHDLLITSAGLWVASDTFYNSVNCGGIYHPGICFFPGTA